MAPVAPGGDDVDPWAFVDFDAHDVAPRVVKAPRRAAGATAYLGRAALCARWGISRATSYRLQAEGYLRPPVRLGPGTARWPLAEVEALERRASEDRAAGP
jgi:predicted DNA-binding transcriptional regulator AlpA